MGKTRQNKMQNLPDPHDIEKVILEWLGVVTAIAVAIFGTISLLWAKWRSTMKQLLEEQTNDRMERFPTEQQPTKKNDDTTTGSNITGSGKPPDLVPGSHCSDPSHRRTDLGS